MLKVENMHIYYGSIHAVKGINIELRKGEIITLIGANGAGKTSVLKALSGIVSVKEGDVFFDNESLLKKSPEKIVKKGIVHVPQGRKIFEDMTVNDNLILGAYARKDKKNINEDIAKVYNFFPRLHDRKNQIAKNISGGEQQMLVIGRGLMSKPKILILDEPSLGLPPITVKEIYNIIKSINNEDGIAIIIAEQNANISIRISDRAYIMEAGRIVLHGDSESISNNSQVKQVYLG